MENIVTAKEVAEFLHIAEATVYRLAKDHKIPAVRIGKQWRFNLDAVREMFAEGHEFEDEEEET